MSLNIEGPVEIGETISAESESFAADNIPRTENNDLIFLA